MDAKSNTESRDSGSNEAALRDLALRLLSHRYRPNYTSEAVELLVGRLPEWMPKDIPILEDSRVIGSLVSVENGYKGCTILLGSDIPPEQALDFYDERLQAIGWSLPDMGGMTRFGGFTGSMHERMMGYQKGEKGPALQVHASEIEDGSTEIRLILHNRVVPSRDKLRKQHTPYFEREQIIPNLNPPRRAQQRLMGGGGGGGSLNTSAQMVTELDPSNLAAHYAAQLQKGGWSPSGDGLAGPLAWSTWDFKDAEGDNWIGMLFLIERSGEQLEGKHLYFMSIHAHKVSGEIGPGGSWRSGPMFFGS